MSKLEALWSDAALQRGVELARLELATIADASLLGELVGIERHDDHTISVKFRSLHEGYAGWVWVATLSRLNESAEVTILEIGQLPDEGALLAPEWVPWSERLEQYREARKQEAAEAKAAKLAAKAAEEAANSDDDESNEDPDQDDDNFDDDFDEDDLLNNDHTDFDDELDGVDFEPDYDDGEYVDPETQAEDEADA